MRNEEWRIAAFANSILRSLREMHFFQDVREQSIHGSRKGRSCLRGNCDAVFLSLPNRQSVLSKPWVVPL